MKMCPLWPIHLFLLYLLAILPVWLLCFHVPIASAQQLFWNVSFDPEEVEKLPMETEKQIYFETSNFPFKADKLEVISADLEIATVTSNGTFVLSDFPDTNNFSFGLTGKFLGHTTVKVRASNSNNVSVDSNDLKVGVIRPGSVIDTIFIVSVSILLALSYVNMGCSLDLEIVKNTLRRPKGPAVGLVSQYIFMPLVSYGLSYAIFTSPNMRLGLFTVGCSPGGGASNMWTYLLGGNLNLSITMTFISNVLAFVAMPLWLFTLGKSIFISSNITIPYSNIVSTLLILIIPVGIGLLIQRYLPKVSNVCRKILGPFGAFMIIFIVIFGIVANLYMFYLFDWRIVIAGMGVPWLGYAFGAFFAKLFGFSFEDIIALSVETGVQNSGIAIVLLRFSLPQPDADLTSVIPVAASIMMPFPLLALLLIFRLQNRLKSGKSNYEVCDDSVKPDSSVRNENIKTELVNSELRNNRY